MNVGTGVVRLSESRAKAPPRPGRSCHILARIHKTLRVMPAMEAGVADHVWGLDEIARLAA
jgi:hypothetical protein